jgi:ribosomal protein S12
MKTLTDRQKGILRRLAKDEFHTEVISPDVGKQLEKRGLIVHDGDYERKEWNRTVAKLWKVRLTGAGINICKFFGFIQ